MPIVFFVYAINFAYCISVRIILETIGGFYQILWLTTMVMILWRGRWKQNWSGNNLDTGATAKSLLKGYFAQHFSECFKIFHFQKRLFSSEILKIINLTWLIFFHLNIQTSTAPVKESKCANTFMWVWERKVAMHFR